MRPGGVAELSLAVFEGSEACGRTSKGGKATWGKASQRFGDRTGDVLGVLKARRVFPGKMEYSPDSVGIYKEKTSDLSLSLSLYS